MNAKTDIKVEHPIIRTLPKWARPYGILARIDRPIGIWLLLLPCLWGITLGDNGTLSPHTFKIVVLFTLGAVIMRAAGCVINDLWDRDLDRKVTRTSMRPIASGEVSVRNGLLFLGILLLAGVLILIQLGTLSIILGICTLPLIALYPLMKRITWWPQAFLGLTFNAGAIIGYTAITNRIEYECVALYIAGVFWTLGYDTIYAHQDIEDDIMAGIKSTARKFGKHSKTWVGGFYILMLTELYASTQAWIAFTPAALHMVWQIKTWHTKNPQSALRVFKSNRDLGGLILIGLMITKIIV